MAKEQFLTFKTFDNEEEALELGTLLKENNIDYLLNDESASFDPTFAVSNLTKAFLVKIQKHDFGKVDGLLQKVWNHAIEEVDDDYYLLNFTDEELIDVITKKDEWGNYDYLLAQKLLKERGKELKPEEIEEIKNQRIVELSKPENSEKTWIYVGYIFAVLGGLLGIYIGWHLLSHKKTLPNGERVYAYSMHDRIHGNRIVIVGAIFFIIWLTLRIINSDLWAD